MKPAAITGANVATSGAIAIAAAGPAGLAVVGAAAATVGGVAVVRRVVRHRRSHPRPPKPPRAPRSPHRSPFGGPGGPGGGAKRPGSGLLSSLFGPKKPGSGPGGLGRPTGPGGGRPSTPNKTARNAWNATKAAKVAKAVGRGARHVGAGVARVLWLVVKAIAKALGALFRGLHRHVGVPLWRRLRRFVRVRLLHLPPDPPKPDPTPEKAVGAKVNRPGQAGADENKENESVTQPNQKPSPHPRPRPTPAPVATTAGGKLGDAAGTGPMYMAARHLHAMAVETVTQGNLKLRTEAQEWPLILHEVAETIRGRAEYYPKSAIDPNYTHAVMQLAATVDDIAQAAMKLAEVFDAQPEVQRLLQPRDGEHNWDVTANQP